jgi:hypothetical protein
VEECEELKNEKKISRDVEEVDEWISTECVEEEDSLVKYNVKEDECYKNVLKEKDSVGEDYKWMSNKNIA